MTHIEELDHRVTELEKELQRLGEIMAGTAELINNLNQRLLHIESQKPAPVLPPAKKEIHRRMEETGDSYQECETELMREKYGTDQS